MNEMKEVEAVVYFRNTATVFYARYYERDVDEIFEAFKYGGMISFNNGVFRGSDIIGISFEGKE